MILNEMYVAIKTLFAQLYKDVFVKNERASGYLKSVLTTLIIGGVLFGAFYSYKFYMHKRESSAHTVLQECMAEFQNVKNGSGSWRDIELALDAAYNQHSSSKLAPYFLAFKADALCQQGKMKDAIEVLATTVKNMSESDDFYGVYKAKLALMKLDSTDELSQKEGLEALKLLADKDGSGKVMALYYLGLYSFDKNDVENAKKYWQKLVLDDQEARKKDDSGLNLKVTNYVGMAKEKLEQLN